MNSAVVLAGGIGSRMNRDTPKQFMNLSGKTVLEHSVTVFQHHPDIDEIVIVGNPVYQKKTEELVLKNNWTKIKDILPGGRERYESSLEAIRYYADRQEVRLLIHDAARPLVSHRIISDHINALESYNAVYTAVPSADTVIRLNDMLDRVVDIPERKYLWKAQTPQSFKLKVIAEAFEKGLQDPGFSPTDDCGVVRKYLPEEEIFVIKGERRNLKITYEEDFLLLEHLLQ